jgi:hypothetical protein
MIVPGSVGDWVQASLMAILLGGTAVRFARALRQEERSLPMRVRPIEGRGALPSFR